jgi:hypothetical protein
MKAPNTGYEKTSDLMRQNPQTLLTTLVRRKPEALAEKEIHNRTRDHMKNAAKSGRFQPLVDPPSERHNPV